MVPGQFSSFQMDRFFSTFTSHCDFFLPKLAMMLATEEPVNKPAMRRGSRMRKSIDPYLYSYSLDSPLLQHFPACSVSFKILHPLSLSNV